MPERMDIPGAPRSLTRDEADAVYTVLVEEAGARSGEDARRDFTVYATRPGRAPSGRHDPAYVFVEWRFGGSLGSGGKLYFFGRRSPWVGCYREHETPERLAIIKRTNARLAALFAAHPEADHG